MSPSRATTRFPPLTGDAAASDAGAEDAGADDVPGAVEAGAATDGTAVAEPLHAAKAIAAATPRAPIRKRNIRCSLLLYRRQVLLARWPCHGHRAVAQSTRE